MLFASFLAAIALALTHAFIGKARSRLSGVPRHWFLSIAGGIPVAFALLQILPTLAADQQAIAAQAGAGILGLIKKHVYLMALVGLLAFYGVERVVKRADPKERTSKVHSSFILSISMFSLMNIIIGYLLSHADRTWDELLIFFLAIGLKFVVNDFGLHENHKEAYDRFGKWIAAGAILLGWAIGYWTEIHRVGLALLRAFLMGAVLLNILKEELPKERESRFWPFALSAGLYALLLVNL